MSSKLDFLKQNDLKLWGNEKILESKDFRPSKGPRGQRKVPKLKMSSKLDFLKQNDLKLWGNEKILESKNFGASKGQKCYNLKCLQNLIFSSKMTSNYGEMRKFLNPRILDLRRDHAVNEKCQN